MGKKKKKRRGNAVIDSLAPNRKNKTQDNHRPSASVNKLIRLEEGLVAGLLLSVFWLFSTHLNGHFTLPKLLAATVFTGLLLIPYAYRAWRGSLNHIPVLLWLPALLLAGWWLFATTQSIHPQTALEGQHGRYNGLLTHLGWLILLLLLAGLPLNINRFRRILLFAYFAIIPVCIHAFMQYVGANPIFEGKIVRPFASIGNPVSLGAILLMMVPFVFFSFIDEISLKRKYPLLVLLSLLIFIILLTGSRGTWLGTVVVVFACLVALWLNRGHSRISLSKYPVIAFVAVVIGLLAIVDWESTLGRFSESAGLQMRLMYFAVAWMVIKDHPVFGNGFESFRLVYPGYRPAEDATYERDTIPTMVHNDLLQLATDNGLPALVLFMVLVTACLWLMVYVARKNTNVRNLLYATTISVIGFIVQGMSGWMEAASTTVFWLVLGLGTSLAVTSYQNPAGLPNKRIRGLISGLSILCLFLISFNAFMLIGHVRAEHVLRKAQSYNSAGLNHSAALFRQADIHVGKLLNLFQDDYYYQDQIGELYLKRLMASPSVNRYRLAHTHFVKARKLNPFDPYIRLHLMQADTIALKKRYIKKLSTETRTDMEELEKMDPMNPTVYQIRSALYGVLGNRGRQFGDILKAKSLLNELRQTNSFTFPGTE